MIKLGDLVNESFGRTSIETPKGYDKAMAKMLDYIKKVAINYYRNEMPKLYDMGAYEYPTLLKKGITFDKIVKVRPATPKKGGAVDFFVSRETGDIYKAASFSQPAKGVRGSIFDPSSYKKYTPHGGWLYKRRY